MFLRTRTSVGIHITDHTLEIAQLSYKRGRFYVDAAVKRPLPKGAVDRGMLVRPDELKAVIEEAFRNALPQAIRPKNVAFSIPDSLIYTHTFRASSGGEHFDAEVRRALSENVPLASEDTEYVTQRLVTTGVSEDVLLLAVSKAALAPWKALLAEMELPVVCYDVEALALYRGLMMHRKSEVVAVVDIGAHRTDISIFDGAGLRMSRQINMAGEDITKSIASSLHISEDEAEERKKKEGVKDSGSQLFTSAVKALEPIGKEIRSALDDFFARHQRRVEFVVLVGGTSQLPGLKEYMQITSDVPVSIGVPVLAIEGAHHEDEYPILARNIGVAAVGLARRVLDRAWRGDACFAMPAEKTKPKQRVVKSAATVTGGARKTVSLFGALPRVLSQFHLFIIGVLLIAGLGAIATFSFKGTIDRFRAGETDEYVPNSEYIKITTSSEGEGSATSTSDTAAPETSISPMVKILNTPTGWLNVRSGPGTTYAQVTRVNPGESYPLLEEKGDWYHIRIGEIEGWIAKQYASRTSN